ncbi:hypothetical protein L1987_06802 [Smallanthus sonchifolius]|uniref:Uncharacterized protein n=1 Tax=Smallanthus sonchifolius TaxID=185202 RepID=A0ACB9JZD9_9ASTR|nr:hypothetical protein L1987_06802 [Smallanthus sonchifolius]
MATADCWRRNPEEAGYSGKRREDEERGDTASEDDIRIGRGSRALRWLDGEDDCGMYGGVRRGEPDSGTGVTMEL